MCLCSVFVGPGPQAAWLLSEVSRWGQITHPMRYALRYDSLHSFDKGPKSVRWWNQHLASVANDVPCTMCMLLWDMREGWGHHSRVFVFCTIQMKDG